MEVSGKKQFMPKSTTSSIGSSEGPSYTCQPCSSEGEDTEADGFCQNCQEYLCRTCIRYHRKTTLTKHHDILDKKNMPENVVPQKVKQLCTVTCEKHTLETIKFFCKDHDTVGCGNCMVIDHKACHVDFIPDIAEDFANGKEYKDLLIKLEKLQIKITAMKETMENGKQATVEMYTVAVKEIKKFRKEIEVSLDHMEQIMLKECDRLKRENELVTRKRENYIGLFTSEQDKIQDRLTIQSKQTADLFVQTKQARSRMNQLEQDMKRETNCTLNQYEFQRNRELDAVISRSSHLGKFISQTYKLQLPKGRNIVDFEPVRAGEIYVKSNSDNHDIWISSMIAISPVILLCVDSNNNSVKVVDTENRCLCSQIYLTSGPWDITAISSDQFAVTLPHIKRIQFLSLKHKELSTSHAIKVNGKCRGIAYHQNTLAVSYVPPAKLQILNVDGKVLRTLMPYPKSDCKLRWPGCIDVGADGICLFVSDHSDNCVLKMTLDCNLLSTYRDMNLLGPRGVTVCKDGSVLVCGQEDNALHLSSPECKPIKTLLTKKDGIKRPQSVCYNDTTSTLYLSNIDNHIFSACDTDNVILVYCQA
ncbi:uncharacterized protein LOC123552725 [Mercenaria mercenaria]|uniref:uncharacterized protein LOC123552725 n=1 Tax=Mercenaria mercenaria TaxID=6596 RepID=UPI00234FB0C9|nr:uncharacterized protein LOC123552725 [Mercenaria mercenaria]